MLLLNNKTIDKLKYDLVREGLVDFEALNLAQDNAKKNSTNLSVELVNENIITEKVLLNFIQNKLHIPYVELSDYTPDKNCLKYISAENARRYNIFPLFMIEDVLTIAMSDPLDLFAINTLFEAENFSIEPVVCAQNSILDALEIYYAAESNEQTVNWQDLILSEKIDDDGIKNAISMLFSCAIDENRTNIFFERNSNGIQINFDSTSKGFMPNILVQRFINVLLSDFVGVSSIDEDIPLNSKFDFLYNNSLYSIVISFLPTTLGSRIAMEINKPIKNLSENFKVKLSDVISTPSIIKIDSDAPELVYSVARYLAETNRVLMVENCVRYNLDDVVQIEIGKNTGLYFDEILSQLEFQKFDIIFFEKIYEQEQFEKLKLLSREYTIITGFVGENLPEFDFEITADEKIA